MIQLGNKSTDSIYLGNKVVTEAYIGSNKIWPEGISYEDAVAILTSEDGTITQYFESCADAATYATNNSDTNWNLTIRSGEVPASCFSNTTNLISLILEEGITGIQRGAFYNCVGLTGDLIIPDSVIGLYTDVFNGCSGFNGNLTIGSNVTQIGQSAFAYCGFTGSLVIPDSVETINYTAFYQCRGFTSLVLGNSISNILNSAFSGCSGFTGSLTLPESLTYIESNAFSHCSGFDDDLSYYGTSNPTSSNSVFNSASFTVCKVPIDYEDDNFCGLPVSKELVSEEYWYGIEYSTASSSPECTRIGNTSLHQSLPIQSQMRGIFLNIDGDVMSSLPSSSWEEIDRSESQDYEVMIEIPTHYVKFETEGDVRRVKMSTEALPGFTEIPKYYVSAYEATLDRRNSSRTILRSIVSTSASCRGGNNDSTDDDNGASLLGKPSTTTSRTDFRTYARNRGTEVTDSWNILTYSVYKDIFWLFVVEYATLNSQKAYNADKDENGYVQGGLGNSVTSLSGDKWSSFNSRQPVIPCGYTDSLGNGTGVVSYTMPFEYDGGTSSYVGEYDESTSYNTGDYVSSGENLYECITDAPAGTELTNTTYFSPVTRTTVSVPRYRGIENPFGHIWKWIDGINIRISPDTADDGDGLSKVYTCDTPSLFSDSSYDNYDYIGDEARDNALYVKEIVFGDGGDIIPSVTGGSSSTYFCDNHYTSIPTTESLRGVLVGGSANYSSNAGLACVLSSYAPSHTAANFGSRLCFIPE